MAKTSSKGNDSSAHLGFEDHSAKLHADLGNYAGAKPPFNGTECRISSLGWNRSSLNLKGLGYGIKTPQTYPGRSERATARAGARSA